MNILVIRRDNIGDLVCTTPLLASLRQRYPQARISALVNTYNAAVLDGNPDLDAVHSYTKLKHRRPGEPALGILLARWRMLRRLRTELFDYIVLAKSGFDRQGLGMARQLRRRHVVGFIEREQAKPAAITMPMAAPALGLHEVEAMQRLARALDVKDDPGPLRIFPDTTAVQAWRNRLPQLRQGTWIGVHISAREPGRRWPMYKWIELIRALTAGNGMRVMLLWAPGPAHDPKHPGDDEAAAAILGECNGAVAARSEQLSELIAALALCHGFVGADGGAMHIAAALRLPVVALFENRIEKKSRWYPWRVPYEMVVPATRDISDISVEQLLQACERMARHLTAAA